MIINVTTSYSYNPTQAIELPIKDWSEVKDWFVKWHAFRYTLDGENWEEIEMDCNPIMDIDTQKPSCVTIKDEKFEKELASE